VLFENLNGGLFAAKNIGVAHNCPKSDNYGDNFGYPAQERNKTQKFQNDDTGSAANVPDSSRPK